MEPITLDDESLYLVLSRRVHRHAKIEDGSRQTLKLLQRMLHLGNSRAEALDEIARNQSVPGSSGLDGEMVFRSACSRAWSEGRSKKGELGLLLSLAHLLDIDERQADRIFETVAGRRKGDGPTSDPALEISDPALEQERVRPPRPTRTVTLLDQLIPALLAMGVLALVLVVVTR